MTPDRPRNESGPAPPREPGHHVSAATKLLNTASVDGGAAAVAGLRRRRAASRRLPDPWKPWRPDELSAMQTRGAIAAAHHLHAAGLPPIFDVETLRAMWRHDHQLAQRLYELAGGDV
jgi:hypothetical protein